MTIDQYWEKVAAHLRCVQWGKDRPRCGARAVGLLLGHDGKPSPGAYLCSEHAAACVTEYREKLGEHWALRVGPCAGWACVVGLNEDGTWTVYDAPSRGCGDALAHAPTLADAARLAIEMIEHSATVHGQRIDD